MVAKETEHHRRPLPVPQAHWVKCIEVSKLNILLAACFAGLVAILVTVSIERWGGVVGGFLGSMPTTIIPASIGIYLASKDQTAFAVAMCATPIGMLLDAGFLWYWRVIPPKLPRWTWKTRLLSMIVISMSLWALTAAATMISVWQLQKAGVGPLTLGWSTMVALALFGILACLRPFPAPKGSRRVGWSNLLARGFLAAAAIGFSVWLSSTGNALASGLASTFPAIFLTTMVSLWISQGEAVPSGAVGPMILGSSSVPMFAMFAIAFFPRFSVAWGAALSWICAVLLTTIPASLWLRSRRKSQT